MDGDKGLCMLFVCILYGYDALAGSVVISIAEFRKDFGFPYGNDYVISAEWQLGFQAAFFAGECADPKLTPASTTHLASLSFPGMLRRRAILKNPLCCA